MEEAVVLGLTNLFSTADHFPKTSLTYLVYLVLFRDLCLTVVVVHRCFPTWYPDSLDLPDLALSLMTCRSPCSLALQVHQVLS